MTYKEGLVMACDLHLHVLHRVRALLFVVVIAANVQIYETLHFSAFRRLNGKGLMQFNSRQNFLGPNSWIRPSAVILRPPCHCHNIHLLTNLKTDST